MSYFSRDGRDDFDSARALFATLGELKHAGIEEDLSLVALPFLLLLF
jgi:hypothetical protein